MFRQSVMAAVCAAGVLSAVVCLNTDRRKEPLVLSSDARGQLSGKDGLPPPAAKPVKPATYDSFATGGTGVTKDNSFARTTPVPNTDTGYQPLKLPAPELGAGPITPPVIAGAKYGDVMADAGRTAGVRGSAPLPPLPPPSSPFVTPKPAPPKLGPPETEPPIQLTGGTAPIPPAGQLPLVPPPSPANVPLSPGELPPVLPVAPPPAPGASGSPIPPSVIKSPVEDPIPGLPSPKLPAAPPIRPQ